jgi:alkylation response protein AidB-like acyl-CoA dehydrogenase
MTYSAPLAHMRFLLREVFHAEQQWAQLPAYSAIDGATVDAILEEGAKLCAQVIQPLNRSGDEEGARLENGKVITPHGFKDAYRQLAAGGWVGLNGDLEYGGQGLPKMLTVLFEEMLYSANNSFTLYVALTVGAALALRAHGSAALQKKYLPKMYSGEWAGAMDLTEPHCGSDLGLLKTRALPQSDGGYQITGTKIFITGGDQDLTANIIHFVLARLPDAPPGAKGISLFLVPKVLVNEDGSLGSRNAVTAASLEHKMGIKGSATCVMNFDGAMGWLVGELHQGLAAMFTMMNYERLSIGIQGIGCGEMSYQNALHYAKDRVQGRAARGTVNANGAADPIIEHADVRRMLLTQRAYNEAGRAFAVYLGLQLDIAKYQTENSRRETAAQRVALLTPVAKAFFTDKGFETCVLGQQVYGGHGYIRENGQEQLVRDVRIAQIYEGTNGIQAMDLLKRKVLSNRAAWLKDFLTEIRDDNLRSPEIFVKEKTLALQACDTLESLTHWLIEQDKTDPDACGAAACDYLHVVGYTTYAWLWLRMMVAQPDNCEHILIGRFYFGRLLPQVSALDQAIRSGAARVMELPVDKF